VHLRSSPRGLVVAEMPHLSRKESLPRDPVAVGEEVVVGVGAVPLARRRYGRTSRLHLE